MKVTKVNDTPVSEIKTQLELAQVTTTKEIEQLKNLIEDKTKGLEQINRKLVAIQSFEL